MPEANKQKFFQGAGGFMKLGDFDKHFAKNARKKGSAGKHFEVSFY